MGSNQRRSPAPSYFQKLACRLPRSQLTRIWNGYDPERSGDIQIVPKEPNFMSGGLTHSGPWAYLQRVPMLWYGPGHVRAVGRVNRPVTMADVAPTMAGHLGYEFEAPDGEPMTEALPSGGGRRAPPKAIVVVVWDGGGRNVLGEYPDAWPTLHRLISRGVWYENATVGSSPSVTPAIHATLGTGAYPRRHGLVDLRLDVGGELVPSFERGPQYMRSQTLADLFDRDMGNRPVVAMLGYRAWHLAMIGHGSSLGGGDRDVAALLDRETGRWFLSGKNGHVFRFASYANQVPGRDEAIRRLDLEDGRQDAVWMGDASLNDPVTLPKTPAYAEWQTAILEELIRREGFGADEVPDLLFTNYKVIDEVSHRWSMNSPQMEAVVRASDQALADLITILNRDLGRGRWVIVVTADHGVTPKPAISGAYPIIAANLRQDIEATFGSEDRRVVRDMRPSHIWMNLDRLEEGGFNLRDVARFVARYSKGENVEDPSTMGPGEADEKVFAAAFPSKALERLPCLSRPT
jgi:arylsulfatase A-like enzyme